MTFLFYSILITDRLLREYYEILVISREII